MNGEFKRIRDSSLRRKPKSGNRRKTLETISRHRSCRTQQTKSSGSTFSTRSIVESREHLDLIYQHVSKSGTESKMSSMRSQQTLMTRWLRRNRHRRERCQGGWVWRGSISLIWDPTTINRMLRGRRTSLSWREIYRMNWTSKSCRLMQRKTQSILIWRSDESIMGCLECLIFD